MTTAVSHGTFERALGRFYVQPEPPLEFRYGQQVATPHLGLTLFGPYDADVEGRPKALTYGTIGTPDGLAALRAFTERLQRPIASMPYHEDEPETKEHFLWPVFPGFAAAFLCELSAGPRWSRTLDPAVLNAAARQGDQYRRAYDVVNLYLEALRLARERDERFHFLLCVVPDEVYANCRPLSRVPGDRADRVSTGERERLRAELELFADRAPDQYDYSVDFRRQLKARAMEHDLPIQIIRESTLVLHEPEPDDRRILTPLSDRAWNLGTAMYYKAGGKPWRVAGARPGVCYVGLAFRRSENDKNPRTACCAAQMFLQTGDGIVFRGEYGPWYSPDRKTFRLSREAAEELLRGVITTYRNQGGEQLEEVFLHARSTISADEFTGYQRGCPDGVKLVGIRVRQAREGLRLLRLGKWVVLRGTTWIRTERTAYLWGSGFKPAILSYDGSEIPCPLRIDIEHGEADIQQVAADILALTKLNYNQCRLGDAAPVTVGFSDAVGEILIANPTIRVRQPQFKYYI